jgi:O-acetyl-ADP-ribose deacetylase (regulator of RNase III)/exonuclease III
MPIYLLFFDHTEKNIQSYNKHISIDTPEYKALFICSDVKQLVKDYTVTFLLSPANSAGFMDGGIDMIYMEMFPGIQNKVQTEIAKFNIVTPLGLKVIPIGSNILVKTDDMQTPYMCCCPTMFSPGSITTKADNVYWAFTGLLQTLKHYTNIEKLVVAIPCLGTGVGMMKPGQSARQIQKAFDDFTNNNIAYNAKILQDSPKGFVIDENANTEYDENAKDIGKVRHIQTKKRTLKLLTWNIWFKQYHFDARMNHIIEELKHHEPDIVCFQEVTRYSLLYFKKNNYINTTYDMMYDPVVEQGGYSDIILIKKWLKECYMTTQLYPQTNMNRKMTRVYLPYFDCEICTTHLESIYKRDNSKYLVNNFKHNQFKFLLEEMSNSKADNAIIAGDFNVGDEDEDTFANLLCNSPFKDVYLTNGNRNSVVNTYDSTINKNINGNFQSRLDRIYSMTKGIDDTNILKPFNYQVIGMTPFIYKEGVHQSYIFPSDHFGVLCTFTV